MHDLVSEPLEHLPALCEFRLQLRTFLSFSESAADTQGITAQQYQLLQVVAESESASITRIAERLLLRHNSAVELIDRAELASLVERSPDPADHRRLLVRLTPRGRTLLIRLLAQHLDFLRDAAPALIASLEGFLPHNPALEIE